MVTWEANVIEYLCGVWDNTGWCYSVLNFNYDVLKINLEQWVANKDINEKATNEVFEKSLESNLVFLLSGRN